MGEPSDASEAIEASGGISFYDVPNSGNLLLRLAHPISGKITPDDIAIETLAVPIVEQVDSGYKITFKTP